MTDLTCAAGVDVLMDYLDGVLSAEARATLESHVAGCPRCAAFVATYQATPPIFRRATATSLSANQLASMQSFLHKLR